MTLRWTRLRSSRAFVLTIIGLAAVVTVLGALVVWILNPGVAPEALHSTSCAGSSGAGAVDSSTPTAAWIMGVRAGSRAGWLEQLKNGGRLTGTPDIEGWLELAKGEAARTDAAVTRMAAVLRVPTPRPFHSSSWTSAVGEFLSFIEGDGAATTPALARLYTRRVCEIYKLGSYWGFSALYRVTRPAEPNVYAPEIEFYGLRLRLSPALVASMTQGNPPDRPPRDIMSQTEEISKQVATYFSVQ